MNENILKKTGKLLGELQKKYNDLVAEFNKQKERMECELKDIRHDIVNMAMSELQPTESMELKTPYDEQKILKNSRDFFDKYYFTEKEPDGRDGCFLKGYARDFWADINKYADYLKKEETKKNNKEKA